MSEANGERSAPAEGRVPLADSAAALGSSRPWSRADRLAAGLLAIAAALLFTSGLAVRSLWGSEGRWAVISREMVVTGDYLTPTINAIPYYDKPLLSYWAIVPFAWMGDAVSARPARLPSALAGIATVLLTFAIGRRLFGTTAAAISGALLATSAMFVFWSRTASADLLNMLAVWVVIWCFVAGAWEGRTGWLAGLYCAAAAGSFMKGPVAAAAAFAAFAFYSAAGVLIDARRNGARWAVVRGALLREFRWLVSRNAAVAIAIGAALFAALLAGPCLVAGDWGLARLMWRENVTRFFTPFDHVEPVWIYLRHTAAYFAPWTVLLLAALWDARGWPASRARRFVLLAAAGVFVFFTASGSRRSYYILPLLPAVALIAGNALARWIGSPETEGQGSPAGGARVSLRAAAAGVTAFLMAGVAAALIYVYFRPDLVPRAPAQLAAAALVGLTALGAGVMLCMERRAACAGMLAASVLVAELWGFTAGFAAAERERTARPFCEAAAERLSGVPDANVAMYRTSSTVVMFYLNRRGLRVLGGPGEVRGFLAGRPDRYVFAKRGDFFHASGELTAGGMAPVLSERYSGERDRRKAFVLLGRAGPVPAE